MAKLSIEIDDLPDHLGKLLYLVLTEYELSLDKDKGDSKFSASLRNAEALKRGVWQRLLEQSRTTVNLKLDGEVT